MGLFDDSVLGVPAISFKGVRRGAVISGTVLPIPVIVNGAVVRNFVREYGATNTDGTPKTYPQSGDRIMGYQFLLQTELSDWKYASAKFEAKALDEYPDEKDTGLRRWFAESSYAAKALKEARRRIGTNPEVGGTFSIKVTGIKTGTASDGSSWEAPDIALNWTPADEAGRKVVDAYVKSDAYSEPQVEPVSSGASPWGDISQGQEEDPPF